MVLTTVRLTVRPSGARDAAALCEIANRREVAIVYAPLRNGHLFTEAEWRSSEGDRPGRLVLAAVARNDGSVVAGARLSGMRLEYLVAPRYWRQGYGRELVQAICHQLPAHIPLPRLQAVVVRENWPSRRILEGLGFRFRGWEQAQARGVSLCLLRYELEVPSAAVAIDALAGRVRSAPA